MTLQSQLKTFREGGDLHTDDTPDFLDELISESDELLLAEIFHARRTKGTTENEIYQLARVMRERCTKVESVHDSFVDIVGTGASSNKTFNVSTAAAFVVAGAGIPVAKHGNKAATSASGSADVLNALGIDSAVGPSVAERCLNELGICFMFAPNFHRLSPTLAKVRRGLGYPTVFNILGPLCNPANAPFQLIGVYDRSLLETTASVLAQFGTRRSWVAHGNDGLDEFTLRDFTSVAEASEERVTQFELLPDDFGVASVQFDHLRVESATDSATLIRSILDGSCHDRAACDLVLINAAVAIFLVGMADSLKDAYVCASESLKSGAAIAKMKDLAKATNK
jgi:anthranilate phosphoribosyltransferase